jgi:hypothetical protein
MPPPLLEVHFHQQQLLVLQLQRLPLPLVAELQSLPQPPPVLR